LQPGATGILNLKARTKPETENGILEAAYKEGKEAALNAVQGNTLENLGESESTVADV
jgi:hypothetical protein